MAASTDSPTVASIHSLDKFSKVAMDPTTIGPCMVVEAHEDVVDNHGGIWKSPFQQFLIEFLTARERAAEAIR